ncbi:C-X-C motif chemokine 9-like [Cheilinus undulatus]|uniref:C-X-C motif chemokine 9-like n=1 Tax=Cheilinus undulatus TaxID=241271 RepID=UPI001BD534F2|nr:C-X-C motif chemokine 9-like [Cheilinus undulatus]
MKPAVIVFLACLLVLCVRGQLHSRPKTCKCSDYLRGRIHSKHIRAGPFIQDPSMFCPRTEITIITTANTEKCLDPQSPQGKLILSNRQKKRAAVTTSTTKSPATTTTPSAQTGSMSSTSVYATTRL